MIKFTYVQKSVYSETDLVKLEKEIYYEPDLGQLLEEFAAFLRGIGFSFDGQLDIVNYDNEEEDK